MEPCYVDPNREIQSVRLSRQDENPASELDGVFITFFIWFNHAPMLQAIAKTLGLSRRKLKPC